MSTIRRSVCPISCALDLLGDKWTLLVIRDMVFVGKRHYKDFLASGEGIAGIYDRIEQDRQGFIDDLIAACRS